MEYQATFGIDCGISSGFGVKSPDYVDRTEVIVANDSQSAYQEAMNLARKFADDYLSNPRTGFTIVQLSSLRGPDGEVSVDASTSQVRRSMLEHLLMH